MDWWMYNAAIVIDSHANQHNDRIEKTKKL